MLFSVVVPVYNVEKYLSECVESVLSQITNDNVSAELLLIDDGSTDKSGKICDEYSEKYPNIVRVFHKENEGLLQTRRYGFKKAQGEYIISCDSDDMLEPNAFKKLENVINDTGADVVMFNAYLYDEKGKKPFFENIFSNDRITAPHKTAVLREFISSYRIVSMCLKAVRRDKIGVDDDYSVFGRAQNGEDTLQSVAVMDNAESFVYLNEMLYDYRMGSGMTNRFDENYFKSFNVSLGLIEEKKEKWNISDFELQFSKKIFGIVGRAITQLRYAKGYSSKEKKAYLDSLRNERFFKEYILNFKTVRKELKNDYQLLIFCLNKGLYGIITAALKLKNILK